ncbi:MAG: acetaldehyde dehydrogenase (acetylating) [Desulfobacteraceae bacterium]|nr:acetaldehyde dehydrogenase (acetylating) [Desulfobacteraceae bacterium]
MVDTDLLSIQEARSLVRCARTALAELAKADQEQVDDIAAAIASRAASQAEALAKMAVEETGFGKWEDKRQKNLLASEIVWNHIKPIRTIGVLNEDKEKKILEIATPAGVIAGLIPSTNPTSTAIYKAMIALKAGNAIVFSPHPSALKCITATITMIQEVLREKGMPENLVSVMSYPTIEGTAELMKVADLILATGGPGMVKAAYSSGTPALGVGAGNVPVFVERSADINDAVTKIFASKTFDNGTVCASEQALITERVTAGKVKAAVIAQGGYFLEGEDLQKVKAVMERGSGGMNPAIVGKDAQTVARMAGINIPANTRIMLSEETEVGPKVPFSKEKLTALMAFYTVEDWQEACELCFKLLKNGGLGHSLAIHSNDNRVVREFAMKKPVSRLLVNTPSTHGAVGLSTNLAPSLTLGCGAVGGSATSDNVDTLHLFNIRRVAYGVDTNDIEAPPAQEREIDVKLLTEMIMERLKAI